VVCVGAERVLVPEGLFSPSVLGSEALAVPQLAAEAVLACAPEQRGPLAKAVLLSGGPVRLPGFASRLEGELERRLGGLGAEVRGPEHGLRPSAWLGGAVCAQLAGFQDMWITRKDYDEHGPSIVHQKCDII